jgi:hypothetical protein
MFSTTNKKSAFADATSNNKGISIDDEQQTTDDDARVCA